MAFWAATRSSSAKRMAASSFCTLAFSCGSTTPVHTLSALVYSPACPGDIDNVAFANKDCAFDGFEVTPCPVERLT